MHSLKSIIPTLADWVDLTPAAVYERQRALVRAGLLHSQAGRGPGSGVRATPEAVAMLLIALLSTDSLTETVQHTKAVAKLKSDTKRCPLTGKRTFAEALAAILSSEELANEVGHFAVARGKATNTAAIILKNPRRVADSIFGGAHPYASMYGLSRRASLALPFTALARLLAGDAK